MEFQTKQSAGASQFQFKQAGSVRKGQFCMLLDQPCRVIDLAVSKPGKHGSAKVCMTGTNIFTEKKIQEIYSTSEKVTTPIVKKFELEVVDIAQDNFVTLLLPNNTLKEDVKLPTEKEEAAKLKQAFESNKDECSVYFTVVQACGQQRIVSSRASKNN